MFQIYWVKHKTIQGMNAILNREQHPLNYNAIILMALLTNTNCPYFIANLKI